jgi:FMN-dependent NADH-azoreductase
MNLLHIDASILGAHSASRQISAAIAERLQAAGDPVKVTYRDLAAKPLPHLTLAHLPADHPLAAAMGETGGSPDRTQSAQVLEEFLAADVVLIAAPMYNFSIPSQLKAWIDRILVPGKTFQYSASGVTGLAGAKRVIVAASRGGLYGAGTPQAPAEHAESYLRAVFGFIGVTQLEFVVAEGLQMGPEPREQAITQALATTDALVLA